MRLLRAARRLRPLLLCQLLRAVRGSEWRHPPGGAVARSLVAPRAHAYLPTPDSHSPLVPRLFLHFPPAGLQGDVAAQVGNSYILTCAVPLLATMVTGLPLCILGCIACNDRQELIRRHNLPAEDPCCSCLTLTFCACCAVIQELNELEAYGRAQAALGPKQHVVLVPAGAAVPPPQPQMVMMPAPQPAAPVAAVAPWAPATTATV